MIIKVNGIGGFGQIVLLKKILPTIKIRKTKQTKSDMIFEYKNI